MLKKFGEFTRKFLLKPEKNKGDEVRYIQTTGLSGDQPKVKDDEVRYIRTTGLSGNQPKSKNR